MKHLSYRLLPLLAATSLATGCVASLEAKTAPAPANAPIAAAAPAPKPEDEQEQRKKVRAVEAARLEFDIAKLAADSARASAKASSGVAGGAYASAKSTISVAEGKKSHCPKPAPRLSATFFGSFELAASVLPASVASAYGASPCARATMVMSSSRGAGSMRSSSKDRSVPLGGTAVKRRPGASRDSNLHSTVIRRRRAGAS